MTNSLHQALYEIIYAYIWRSENMKFSIVCSWIASIGYLTEKNCLEAPLMAVVFIPEKSLRLLWRSMQRLSSWLIITHQGLLNRAPQIGRSRIGSKTHWHWLIFECWITLWSAIKMLYRLPNEGGFSTLLLAHDTTVSWAISGVFPDRCRHIV